MELKDKYKEFQNRSRLYVIGALEPEEMRKLSESAKSWAKRRKNSITQCYALHEAFAISVRPAKASTSNKKNRLMSMVPDGNRDSSARNASPLTAGH